MCGIAGILDGAWTPAHLAALKRMADAQRHRGPDGEGFALLSLDPHGTRSLGRAELENPKSEIRNPKWPGGFAFRRLAILDLTDAAAQPMSNDDGSLWLMHNGEVYNYLELRAELEAKGHRFRSTGDTEVALKAYETWGTECFARFNGMWGMAFWDARRGELVLCRDRFGVKPLHYYFDGGRLVFASEIKALLEVPWVPREADETAVADYLVNDTVNASERTFFKGISAVPPGHILTFRPGALSANQKSEIRNQKWWSLADHLEPPPPEREAAEKLRALFTDAVRLRLRSDVPVGTALSGGIDSSSIVCVARPHLTAGNQKAFSACYEGFAQDEKRYVDLVVRHTGVESHIVRPSTESLAADLSRLVWHQEEPFGGTSMYAQFKVFELARAQGVPVTLDGQGADEQLAGYDFFRPVQLAGLLLRGCLGAWWRELSAFARHRATSRLFAAAMTAPGLLSQRQLLRLASRLCPDRTIAWATPALRQAARIAGNPKSEIRNPKSDRLNQRLYDFFTVDLLPSLLRYEDRSAMAHGVESRLPFMDWRLVAYVFSLPASMKIRGGETKWILRQAMRGIVPEEILGRHDKIGFATPESDWLSPRPGGFVAEAMESAIRDDCGWWDPRRLRRFWRRYQEHPTATRPLWRIVNIVLWRDMFLRGRTP